MELKKNIIKKESIRSITNKTNNLKLFRIDSNSDFSSVSKKTGAFEERNMIDRK